LKTASIETPPNAARALARSKYGYILLTRKGKPIAYFLPTEFYDEEDIGYMTNPAFWKMVEDWRRDDSPGVPLEEIERELKERENKEQRRVKPHSRNGRKGKRNAAA